MSLDTEISALKTDAQDLGIDIPAAFQRFRDETNLSKSVLIVGGIIPGSPGNPVDVPITLIPGSFQLAGLQADILIPSGFTFVSITPGPVVLAAQKQLQMAPGAGFERFIVFGLNATVIGQGMLATIRFSIAPATAKRQYPIILSNPIVADAFGNPIVVSAVSGTVIL